MAAPVANAIVPEVAAVRAPEVKVKVKLPAVPTNFKPEKVATPAEAVAVNVVVNVPVPVAMATVTTVELSVVTVLP